LKKVEILKCPDCNFQKARVKSKKGAGNCPECAVKVAVVRGIQNFHFHDLRHTFASHLIMAGVDIKLVKELLVHKDIKMTLRYSHLAPSHLVKAVDLLDKTINEKIISKKKAKKEGSQNG